VVSFADALMGVSIVVVVTLVVVVSFVTPVSFTKVSVVLNGSGIVGAGVISVGFVVFIVVTLSSDVPFSVCVDAPMANRSSTNIAVVFIFFSLSFVATYFADFKRFCDCLISRSNLFIGRTVVSATV
jgi:hypothetical protein